MFRLDTLSGFITLAIGVFFVLTCVYSSKFMRSRPNLIQYYLYILLTAVASVGVALANNLILLLVCWGFLGLTLYLLINMGDASAYKAAKKSLIIVGGSDALLIFGIGIIYYFSGTMQMDRIRLEFNSWLLVLAYICVAIACFAKSGAIPVHTWIPDCAKSAPIPVSAFLPASLDKLLGIYLLFRLSLNLFVMNNGLNAFLMITGSLTIIAAVMMALVQHNMKKLLGYHAVSQVGYMVLGIGTGNAIGIAGGLFHMLNHAVYKSCLFFGAGNVEYRAKQSELDELGGLGRLMPVTYLCVLIASLSISGVPPFNGFVSKWLIYQGLILRFSESGSTAQLAICAFCLTAAMFGSALTLASFMKLIHSVFLGQRFDALKYKDIKEVSPAMWVPCAILAAICLIFGVFAFSLPLKFFIFPAISAYLAISPSAIPGFWSPGIASLLIALGLLFGFIVFKLSGLKLNMRKDTEFCGGELTPLGQENMVTGVDFYNTVKETGFLGKIYKRAQEGQFDIYTQGRKLYGASKIFQKLHNGVLPSYLVWVLLGMAALLLALMR